MEELKVSFNLTLSDQAIFELNQDYNSIANNRLYKDNPEVKRRIMEMLKILLSQKVEFLSTILKEPPIKIDTDSISYSINGTPLGGPLYLLPLLKDLPNTLGIIAKHYADIKTDGLDTYNFIHRYYDPASEFLYLLNNWDMAATAPGGLENYYKHGYSSEFCSQMDVWSTADITNINGYLRMIDLVQNDLSYIAEGLCKDVLCDNLWTHIEEYSANLRIESIKESEIFFFDEEGEMIVERNVSEDDINNCTPSCKIFLENLTEMYLRYREDLLKLIGSLIYEHLNQ